MRDPVLTIKVDGSSGTTSEVDLDPPHAHAHMYTHTCTTYVRTHTHTHTIRKGPCRVWPEGAATASAELALDLKS